jgi:hypothetical protein
VAAGPRLSASGVGDVPPPGAAPSLRCRRSGSGFAEGQERPAGSDHSLPATTCHRLPHRRHRPCRAHSRANRARWGLASGRTPPRRTRRASITRRAQRAVCASSSPSPGGRSRTQIFYQLSAASPRRQRWIQRRDGWRRLPVREDEGVLPRPAMPSFWDGSSSLSRADCR